MLKIKKQTWAAFALVALVSFAPVSSATAADAKAATTDTKTPQGQQVATRAYKSNGFVQYGTIVTLDEKDPTKVIAAPESQLTKMLGVAIAPSDSAITLTDNEATDKTFVATSGRYTVLVSNQGGSIKPGDYITVSSVTGVGTKTGTSQGLVLGTAATAFDGKSGSLTTTELKDSKGVTHKVSIGVIQADINIGQNPFLFRSTGGVPKTLNVVTSAITGKPVSAIRIYIGLAVLMMVLFTVGTMVYSGIRGAFAAIGRNPLARKSILRGMIQVITTALIIFTFGLLGVYLILKL